MSLVADRCVASCCLRGDPDDDELLSVVLPLLRELSQAEDVTPLLEAHFQMPSWFASRGRTARDIIT